MKKTTLAIAVATAMGAAGTASAAPWILTGITVHSGNGDAAMTLAGDLTFESVGSAFVANGAFSGTGYVAVNPLMTWQFGAGTSVEGTFSGGSFDCIEGAFGGFVGSSICGNYSFGGNYANDSTVNTDGSNRILGGDDSSVGPAQSMADFVGYYPAAGTDFVTTFNLSNAMGPGTGNRWNFVAAVPVPAAAWLFGSALGLLGWARRRTTA